VRVLGAPHRHFRQTDSTNARAKELAEAGAPGGLVVTADEQSSGRGRQGRAWFAPPRTTLLYSALLRPAGDRPLLPLAVPLAVCEAAEELASVRCEIKWPNDVWIEGRKLAGILLEARPEADGAGWAIAGVGLNLAIPPERFPPELRGRATSLGIDHGFVPALDALNRTLAAWIARDDGEVLEAFRARDALAGRRISWHGGAGIAAGIDDVGHLLVDRDDGTRAILGAGEVHLSLG
jgi:BirA family transcriptional regulator, biotin operon repressor / biotin---[acetyl-CoA-carboxylase] ligase